MSAISSLSNEYVRVPVSATESGAAVDPTASTVTMAFTAVGAKPSAFNAASWETDPTRSPSRFYARCVVGPSGAATLASGTYWVWVKISGISPETPVILAPGNLIVT